MRLINRISKRFASINHHQEAYKTLHVKGVQSSVGHNWRKLFFEFDQSKDGLISRKCFHRMMTHIEYDEEIHGRTVDELFDAVDIDNSQEIDIDEFASIAVAIENRKTN